MGGAKDYRSGDTVQYATILTNAGGHFQPGSNQFICPQTAMYMFAITAIRNDEREYAIFTLMIDDTPVFKSFGTITQNAASSNLAFVQCNSGQRVYVRCHLAGNCSMRSDVGNDY